MLFVFSCLLFYRLVTHNLIYRFSLKRDHNAKNINSLFLCVGFSARRLLNCLAELRDQPSQRYLIVTQKSWRLSMHCTRKKFATNTGVMCFALCTLTAICFAFLIVTYSRSCWYKLTVNWNINICSCLPFSPRLLLIWFSFPLSLSLSMARLVHAFVFLNLFLKWWKCGRQRQMIGHRSQISVINWNYLRRRHLP